MKSLKWKVVFLLSVVSAVFAGVSYYVQQCVVLPDFYLAEFDQATSDLHRCLEAINRDCEHLSGLAKDWGATWDEAYRYIVNVNEDFDKENLNPATFDIDRLSLLALVRPDGQMVWGEVRNKDEVEALIPASDILEEICRTGHPLLKLETTTSGVAGVLMTRLGPMLIASRPITTSSGEGPIRGAVIMGRLFDEAEIKGLAERTRIELALWNLTTDETPQFDREAFPHFVGDDPTWIRSDNPDEIQGYAPIRDIYGNPALLLRANLSRAISQQGLAAARLATGINIGGGFAVLLAIWFYLQRKAINPLRALAQHAARVGTDGDLSVRLNMPRKDEIGILAGEFDTMVSSLAEFRKRLLHTAHRAGMADTAVDVLHNVGNSLNTVNVSAGIISEKLRNSEIAGVGQAAQLMKEHEHDLGDFIAHDERGRQLPSYLEELAKYLAGEQETMLKEMDTLCRSIENIKQVVNSRKGQEQSAASGEDNFNGEQQLTPVGSRQ